MIEMRWLIVPTGETPRGWLRGVPPQMWEEVLQFREGGYDMIEKATGNAVWHGTDWQDVPIASTHGAPSTRATHG